MAAPIEIRGLQFFVHENNRLLDPVFFLRFLRSVSGDHNLVPRVYSPFETRFLESGVDPGNEVVEIIVGFLSVRAWVRVRELWDYPWIINRRPVYIERAQRALQNPFVLIGPTSTRYN